MKTEAAHSRHSRKCKLRQQQQPHFHLRSWQKLKRITPSACRDSEKKTFLFIAGRNVASCDFSGKELGSLKTTLDSKKEETSDISYEVDECPGCWAKWKSQTWARHAGKSQCWSSSETVSSAYGLFESPQKQELTCLVHTKSSASALPRK